MNADEKQCPMCAEVIKREAVICRFCGHKFVTPLQAHEIQIVRPLSNQSKVVIAAIVVLAILIPLLSAGFDRDRVDEMPAQNQTQVGQESIEPQRPVMVAAGIDVVVPLEEAGAPWNGDQLFDDTNYTGGSVDLSRRTIYFRSGSITIDRPDSGGIYMIMLHSGTGDQCGDGAPLERALARLSPLLNIPALDNTQLDAMKSVWKAQTGMEEIEFPRVLLRAVGGCVNTLVIRAT